MKNKKDRLYSAFSRIGSRVRTGVIFPLMLFPIAGFAQMVDNGDGTITDMSTNLMWLKNADNGNSDWSGAAQWADNLTIGGYTDWRIPSGVNSSDGQVCNSQPAGANCPETEFGSLYFGYGAYNLYNSGVFQNIVHGSYWTSTEFPADTTRAMAQDFIDGGQNPLAKSAPALLWAVRDADPAPPPALVDNGDGTVTDTEQCLTWTNDANLPCTQGFGNGNWQGACWFYSLSDAEEWADQLDFAGHQDWRLSSEVRFADTSELEILFYSILKNASGGPITDTGPFTNVLQATPFTFYDNNFDRVTIQRTHERYWISFVPVNPGREPSFNINDQTYDNHFMTDGHTFSAWAVRDSCDIIPKACDDGTDNDGDGLADTDDSGCEDANDNDESGGLIDNGDGTVLDADVCLMWAKDANLAGGHLDFEEAHTFAGNAALAGHDDWRLPNALNFDGTGPCVTVGGAEACIESELGHLYYTEIGNPQGGPLQNTGPFANMTPVNYWTGTESMPGWAYEFSFLVGSQNNAQASHENRALIVRDVVDPAVGCPAAAAGASQCSDGIDNDEDGLVDYPEDTGCCRSGDASEGFRFLRGELTTAIAKAAPQEMAAQFERLPVSAAQIQTELSKVFMCRNLIPNLRENFEIPICFEWPDSFGLPQACPLVDCVIDGPGCMDPYQFRRLTVPEEALQSFAQLIEGQLSDRDFEDQIKAMVADRLIMLEADAPRKTRYLPPISLMSAGLIAVGVIALFAIAFVSGRRRRG